VCQLEKNKMKSFKDYLTEAEQVDEIIDPSTYTAKALRYFGRKFATAFPWIAVGGATYAASGLLAPLVAVAGGATAAISALGVEAGLATGVAGAYAAPSIIQTIKDLFSADENSIQAGIKSWVEKQVGDEADVAEFILVHSKAAYTGQTNFRWRAKDWPVKLSKEQAEAHLEKHDKYWLDSEKQKVIDAEKANSEKPDTLSAPQEPVTTAPKKESMAHLRDLVAEMDKPKTKFQVGQMVKFGMWNKPEQHLTGKIVDMSTPYVLQVDVDGKVHEVHLGNKSMSVYPAETPSKFDNPVNTSTRTPRTQPTQKPEPGRVLRQPMALRK
jgi:hypothetical protein